MEGSNGFPKRWAIVVEDITGFQKYREGFFDGREKMIALEGRGGLSAKEAGLGIVLYRERDKKSTHTTECARGDRNSFPERDLKTTADTT